MLGNTPMEAAYIYEIVDSSYTWTEVQKIATSKNSISRGLFGASVAISRNKYAVVGAYTMIKMVLMEEHMYLNEVLMKLGDSCGWSVIQN